MFKSNFRYKLNGDELNALHGMNAYRQLLYIRSIRPRMKFNTGYAGTDFPLAYHWMIAETEFIPERGSKEPAFKFTKAGLRAAIQALVDQGLIERVVDHVGKTLPLVFFCPLADKEKNYPDEEQHRNNTPATTQEQHTLVSDYVSSNSLINNNFSVDSGCGESVDSDAIYNTATTQDEQHNTGITGISNNQSILLIPIPKNWFPSEQVKDLINWQYNLSEPEIAFFIMEFRDFWLKDGGKKRNWDSAFRAYIPHAIKRKKSESDLANGFIGG